MFHAEEERMSKSKDDAPHELESQFVLRLPPVRGRLVWCS